MSNIQIIHGDWIEQLRLLPDKSVQCCVTSPPYWGLRDYGTAKWKGGDSSCDHIIGEIRTGLGMEALGEKYRGGGKKVSEPKPMTAKGICPKCGAIRIDNQLGLEKTPEEYIEKIVAGFREIKRVLRDDGTLWLNLGDSYATHGGCKGSKHSHNFRPADVAEREGIYRAKPFGAQIGLKEKDLVGIPWRCAFALQADGWYLRQDIIWHKPNPMPESVTDRCTKSHEYIFLLSKSSKYYYDQEAIKEEQTESTIERAAYGWAGRTDDNSNGSRTGSTFKRMAESGEKIGTIPANGMRNKRSVWSISTKPYREAHFATFPPEIPRLCILAGSKKGDTILDPFCGSGASGEVALKLDRNFIGIELNEQYVNDLIIPRLNNIDPLFRVLSL